MLFLIEYGQENIIDNSTVSLGNLYKTADGRIVALENINYTSNSQIKEIDLSQKGLGTEYPIKVKSPKLYDGNAENELYISIDNKLASYDLETGDYTVILDWLQSGIITTGFKEHLSIIPDGRVMFMTDKSEISDDIDSSINNDKVIILLSKVDSSEVPDKELITLYAWDLSYSSIITEFNQNSTKYQIEVTQYGIIADEIGSSDAGVAKLNNDLIAGKIPDMFLLESTSKVPIDSYISKEMISNHTRIHNQYCSWKNINSRF